MRATDAASPPTTSTTTGPATTAGRPQVASLRWQHGWRPATTAVAAREAPPPPQTALVAPGLKLPERSFPGSIPRAPTLATPGAGQLQGHPGFLIIRPSMGILPPPRPPRLPNLSSRMNASNNAPAATSTPASSSDSMFADGRSTTPRGIMDEIVDQLSTNPGLAEAWATQGLPPRFTWAGGWQPREEPPNRGGLGWQPNQQQAPPSDQPR